MSARQIFLPLDVNEVSNLVIGLELRKQELEGVIANCRVSGFPCNVSPFRRDLQAVEAVLARVLASLPDSPAGADHTRVGSES